jgi:glycosyltransferase involved in cell wall biosynthesis
MIKISIIIPVYNVEKYIGSCLDSIISQTLEEIEIICVEDGGTDSSLQILNRYAQQCSKIKVFSYEGNRGQAYARNYGLQKANGKYCWFVDSDDLLNREDALEKMYQYAEKNEADGLLFDADILYENQRLEKMFPRPPFSAKIIQPGIYTGAEYFSEVMENAELYCYVWRQLWKTDYLRNNGLLFCEDTSPHEDALFSFEAITLAPRISYIKEKFYIYRIRENSSITSPMSEKRLRAQCLCHFYARDFVRMHELEKEIPDAVCSYLNQIKARIREMVAELLDMDVDIFRIKWDNAQHALYYKLMLSEEFLEFPRELDIDEYKRIKNSKRIIVYGIGGVGKDVVRLLDKMGVMDYRIAVTKITTSTGNRINNQKIYELKELTDYKDDSLVIIAVRTPLDQELTDYALQMGFRNFIHMSKRE